jgi:hypothetical protein
MVNTPAWNAQVVRLHAAHETRSSVDSRIRCAHAGPPRAFRPPAATDVARPRMNPITPRSILDVERT